MKLATVIGFVALFAASAEAQDCQLRGEYIGNLLGAGRVSLPSFLDVLEKACSVR